MAARKRQRTWEGHGEETAQRDVPVPAPPQVSLPPWHYHDDIDASGEGGGESGAGGEGGTEDGSGTTCTSASTIFIRRGTGYLVVAAGHGGDLSGGLPDRTSGCMEPGTILQYNSCQLKPRPPPPPPLPPPPPPPPV